MPAKVADQCQAARWCSQLKVGQKATQEEEDYDDDQDNAAASVTLELLSRKPWIVRVDRLEHVEFHRRGGATSARWRQLLSYALGLFR
jgi:hypothetical protein